MAKRGRPLSPCPDVAKLRELIEAKELATTIGRYFGRSPKTLYKWVEKYGLPKIYREPKLPPKWGRGTGSIYTSQGRVWQSLNTPEKLAAMFTADRLELFWLKVRKAGAGDCWLWTGSIGSARGYGQITLPGGLSTSAHRVSWMIHNGVIPADMHVLHNCDVRICVNPAHLRLGTNEENMADRDRKGRMPHGERCAAAKLTPDQVREIRASTEPVKVLAERYGIHSAHVSKVRLGRKWQHLSH